MTGGWSRLRLSRFLALAVDKRKSPTPAELVRDPGLACPIFGFAHGNGATPLRVSMDVEFKVTREKVVVLEQARPWVD